MNCAREGSASRRLDVDVLRLSGLLVAASGNSGIQTRTPLEPNANHRACVRCGCELLAVVLTCHICSTQDIITNGGWSYKNMLTLMYPRKILQTSYMRLSSLSSLGGSLVCAGVNSINLPLTLSRSESALPANAVRADGIGTGA